jgi:hypothetical protein
MRGIILRRGGRCTTRNVIISQGCGSLRSGSRIIACGRGTFEGIPCTQTNFLDLPGILVDILQSTKLREDITFEQHIIYLGR